MFKKFFRELYFSVREKRTIGYYMKQYQIRSLSGIFMFSFLSDFFKCETLQENINAFNKLLSCFTYDVYNCNLHFSAFYRKASYIKLFFSYANRPQNEIIVDFDFEKSHVSVTWRGIIAHFKYSTNKFILFEVVTPLKDTIVRHTFGNVINIVKENSNSCKESYLSILVIDKSVQTNVNKIYNLMLAFYQFEEILNSQTTPITFDNICNCIDFIFGNRRGA